MNRYGYLYIWKYIYIHIYIYLSIYLSKVFALSHCHGTNGTMDIGSWCDCPSAEICPVQQGCGSKKSSKLRKKGVGFPVSEVWIIYIDPVMCQLYRSSLPEVPPESVYHSSPKILQDYVGKIRENQIHSISFISFSCDPGIRKLWETLILHFYTRKCTHTEYVYIYIYIPITHTHMYACM